MTSMQAVSRLRTAGHVTSETVQSGQAKVATARSYGIASWHELRALGSAALHLPGVLATRGCTTSRQVRHHDRLPVVLVHGYASTASVWGPLQGALTRAGFGHIVTVNYNSFSCDPAAVCDEVTRAIYRACSVAGASRAHVVGHSLGGLLVRQVLASSPVRTMVRTAVTIATPHRGAPLSWIAPGRCRPVLRDAARAADRIGATPSPMRWIAYQGEMDRVVTASSARVEGPPRTVTNISIPESGHMTICRHPELLRSLTEELLRAERSARPLESPTSSYALAA
jgi:pimeloyl-ACP methyl ester carboxylesterase